MAKQRFKNKVVWITGASSGIGEASAKAFANEGAYVIVSARREQALKELAQSIGADRTLVLPVDLTDAAARNAAVQEAMAWRGHIDVLLNNAGVTQRASALDTSEDAARKIMDVNFFAPIELTRAVLPHMLERNQGTVSVVSSVTGYVATPMRSTYAASKHAIQGYFNALEAELHDTDVHVTLILPGYIATPITQAAVTADGSPLGQAQQDTQDGMDPDACATVIVDAIAKKKREQLVGGSEIYGVYLKRFFPKLTAKIVRRAVPK